MTEPLAPDICVIGADAGGLAIAGAAAALGVPTVLIENGGMGDEYVKKSGRVPAKALVAAAEHINALRNGARFGAKSPRFGIDFAAVNAHLHDVIGALAPNAASERFTGLGVHVISGSARFADAETVAVDGVPVRARRFVIATGCAPVLPAIPGLIDTPHFTSETLSDLAQRPRHLIVIGAGSIGLELAQAFRRLGSEVTVLEAATPLADEDRECATIVRDALEREGITLRTGVEIAKVNRAFGKARVVLARHEGTETIEGSHLLVAAGRRANLDDLDLEAAGIRCAPHGVIVDGSLRTTNKRVYAIGGAVDGPKLDALATYHAGLVIRHALFRLPVSADTRAVPRVTFTDPELAQVGLTEDEARVRKGVIRILRWPYRENDRAQAEGATDGHIKVITDRRGGILGVTIVGAQAGESIVAWTLAIRQRLNIWAFAGLAVPQPSYAEMGRYAALSYFARSLTSPWVRRIIAWLRRYG